MDNEQRLERLEVTVADLAEQQRELVHHTSKMSECTEKMERHMEILTRVAVKQEDHQEAIGGLRSLYEKLEERLRSLEQQLPVLNLTSGWVQEWAKRAVMFSAGGGIVWLVLEYAK